MNNEDLTKIAWTRELTDERVRVAAAYWLDCSPHERIEADGIILARYARMAMDQLELAVKALEQIDSIKESYPNGFDYRHGSKLFAKAEKLASDALEEIKRLGEGVNK